jgi:hypothetical protein
MTTTTTAFEITTPRLAPGADPVELTYNLIGGLYGEMRHATMISVRRGGLTAYVEEHTTELALWLDSSECVIPAPLRALGSAAVVSGQAFAAACH